jgi:leader peptidase (prepilin peptidase)/N-methyltransferase
MQELLGAMFFGFCAYAGVLLAAGISATPYDDGPPPAQPPVRLLVAAAALLGAAVLHYNTTPHDVSIFAMVTGALAAVWCTDMRFGIVPDVFTLIPLALIAAIALLQQDTWTIASAVIVAAPFSFLALISKGRGMGWGDVKLAALGGAVLGAQAALFMFSAGCVVAVIYAYARGRARSPIAFAPYLAGSIGVAMPLVSLARL